MFVQTEITPNPLTLKFLPGRDVLGKGTLEFKNKDEASNSPLAEKLFGIEKLNVPRSNLPAITHVDYSARVQTVSNETNPRYYGLIKAFKKRTGCSMLVNTSFNVRGEPIVCTPQDAYRCFMRTEMDVLVLQNQILFKEEQPKVEKNETWRQEFDLD